MYSSAKLQNFTDICMVGAPRLYILMTLKSYILASFQQITFKLGSFLI